MDECMDEWMNECMYEWMNGWMNGWMNEWMNGCAWMDKYIECNEWFMYECHYSMSDSFEDVSDVSSDGT